MLKYKVGQKVKVLVDGYGIPKGTKGTVAEVNDMTYHVSNNDGHDFIRHADVKSVGRLIGSKNAKTKVAKVKAPVFVREEGKLYVGDTVKRINGNNADVAQGTICKIVSIDYDLGSAQVDAGRAGVNHDIENLQLVTPFNGKLKAVLPPKFILQYELDQDPFELFTTMKEVKARIAVLAENRSLKRDKIFIYEIANIQKVELGVSITLK